MLGCGIWELNPVLKEVVINPVNELVDTLTAAFVRPVRALFLCSIENTLNNPVISLHTKDLTPESQSGSTTQNSQSLKGFRELVGLFLTEGDTSPLEYTCLIHNVRDNKGLVFCQECSVFFGKVVVHLNCNTVII